MTRIETLEAYNVAKRSDMITSPGKFEGEQIWAPAFWEASGDGCADMLDWSDGTTTYIVNVTNEDRTEWPELDTSTVAVHMQESESGFVSCEELTQEKYDHLLTENEADQPEDEENEDEPEDTRPAFYECGICGHCHPAEWNGDCREDANHFTNAGLDEKYGQDGWREVPMPGTEQEES